MSSKKIIIVGLAFVWVAMFGIINNVHAEHCGPNGCVSSYDDDDDDSSSSSSSGTSSHSSNTSSHSSSSSSHSSSSHHSSHSSSHSSSSKHHSDSSDSNDSFGCSGSIGNTVWYDANNNGKQDIGELGIPGVRVWLHRGNKVYEDITDGNGRYEFQSLCKGSYLVIVKHEDMPSLYPTYDHDLNLDHKTRVRLKGDKDRYTKADFGYRGAVTPDTGPGLVLSFIFAVIATGVGVYYYRRRHTKLI